MKRQISALAVISVVVLSACSGGGGGDAAVAAPPPAVIISNEGLKGVASSTAGMTGTLIASEKQVGVDNVLLPPKKFKPFVITASMLGW
jgi:hypothetical protein